MEKYSAAPITQRHRIWRDFFAGLILSAVLGLAGLWIGRTSEARQFERMTYDWLQLRLEPARELPITVVDIGGLGVDSTGATSREALIALIGALAAQHPKAIGIDIDFSPEDGRFVSAADPILFRYCLLQRKAGVPVYLGVWRSQALPPAQWLGESAYQTLAASLVVPNESARMVRWIRSGYETAPGRTMSSALADAMEKPAEQWPGRLPRLFARVSESELPEGRELSVGEFLVDYSPLERLSRETIRLKPDVFSDKKVLSAVIASREDALRGKMVMVGDATLGKATDTFVVPGRRVPVPGVYAHASAAYTLVAAPLYEFREGLRPFIDTILGLGLLLIITAIRLHYDRKTRAEVDEHRLVAILIALTVLATFVFAGLLVRVNRVMWDDFLLVSAMLILHPWAEAGCMKLYAGVKKTIPSWWRGRAGNENTPR